MLASLYSSNRSAVVVKDVGAAAVFLSACLPNRLAVVVKDEGATAFLESRCLPNKLAILVAHF